MRVHAFDWFSERMNEWLSQAGSIGRTNQSVDQQQMQ